MHDLFSQEYAKTGYMVVKAQDLGPWELRENLHAICCEKLNEINETHERVPVYVGRTARTSWFDNFHRRGLQGPELNKLRLDLQEAVRHQVGPTLFASFPIIERLVGPDVVHQRGCNLVIAQPGDSERAPTHRDAPLNSNFEVVCWVPMNDCHGTKSMRMLNLDETRVALAVLKDQGYAAYKDYADCEAGVALEVPFGSACIFWAGLVHSVPINQTNQTRWVINHRFKSFWAPYGAKGSGYFTTLQTSPLTRLGLEAT